MTTYRILRQFAPYPAEVPLFCQPGFFFNEPEHLQQQHPVPFHLLTALNESTQQAEARCAFFVCSERALSPAAAPFGSIEFTETLPDSVLDNLLQSLMETARQANASMLRVVNYPHCYAPRQADRLADNLAQKGFRVVRADQNFFIPITNEVFETIINSAERRRLRKCRQAQFAFEHWLSPDIEQVVSFLAETRQQQGYPLTLSIQRLTHLLLTFPSRFPVFVVRDELNLIALTIAVQVRQDILYNFLPASCPDYHTFSPMVMLTDGLFTYCQQQGIRLLDLGVSLDADRQPKPSLMRFKRNLGAKSSPKLIFEKTL